MNLYGGDDMTRINVLPADTYYLINKSFFTEQDRKMLTMFYQPIIGVIATSLYFTLWSFLDREEDKKEKLYTHYHLMTNMKLKLDVIVEAREKLEGIGLLKTYCRKNENGNTFIYEMFSPLSVSEFLSSPLLNTLLISNIGENDYKKLISNFEIKKPNYDDYIDITCSFKDIYNIKNDEKIVNFDNSYEKKSSNNINVKCNIDIDSVLDMIPDEMLNKNRISKEIIDLINNLVYLYDFNEEQLKNVLINSLDTSHVIDKEKLRYNARNLYKFDHHSSKPTAIYKTSSNKISDTDVSNKSKIIYSFENTSPYDFLVSKYNGAVPAKTDVKLIEFLLVDMKLEPSVVNVLIDYVLKTNNNKLTKSYVETIAGQWKRNNISTASDALSFAKREYCNTRKGKIAKKQDSPKWLNKKIESTIATKEEQENITKMLKELVGE